MTGRASASSYSAAIPADRRSDTWDWDGTLWTQVADTGPSARQGLAMAFDPTASRVVLFGGASGSNFLADSRSWDGSELTQVADTVPAPRNGSAIADDVPRNRIDFLRQRGPA